MIDLARAEALATELHEGQTRSHGAPYIEHPLAVRRFAVDLAGALGLEADARLEAAALLHDVIEDSDIDEPTLAEQVDADVARDVAALSKAPKQPGQPKHERTAAYFSGLAEVADDRLRVLKVADRLHNLFELPLRRDADKARSYLDDTLRWVLPLAQGAASAAVAAGLSAALEDAMRLAARRSGVDLPEAVPAGASPVPAGVYVIADLDADSDHDAVVALCEALLRGGPALLQLRAKALSDAAALDVADRVAALCEAAAVPFIVNDRADMAMATGAAGVHVGSTDVPPHRVRRVVPDQTLVGASSHDLAAAREAATRGADYVAFGPVYLSPTKQGHADVTGVERLKDVAEALTEPVVAIGGINSAERMAEVARAGARCGAVISVVANAERPAETTRRLGMVHVAAAAAERAS
jgi:thiamine-phosphate diphosphorylase